MNKIYISSLLIALLAGAQSIRAQESDLDALMDSPAGSGTEATATAPAKVDSTQPAAAESNADASAASTTAGAPAQDLFSRGVAAYNAGEYDKAENIFEAMLAKDPYDTRAMKYLRLNADKTISTAEQRKEAFRAAAMADIKKGWTPDLKNAVAAAAQPEKKVESAQDKAVKAMTAHLKSMMIPTLDFRDANIKDVVLFLTETCRRMDPSHNGINIVLLGLNNSDAAGSEEGNNITISVRDMSLYDTLQAVVEMANLKFEVEPEMVTIMPLNYVRTVDLTQKTFEVITEVGDELSSMAAGSSGGGGQDDLFGSSTAAAAPAAGPVDVKGYFSLVQWPDRSSATYYPAFHKLVVKNTPESIKKVKQTIDVLTDKKIRERSNQVQIEAKFVEFSQGALQELGFNWNVYGTGSVGGFQLGQGNKLGANSGTYYQPATGYSTVQNVNRGIATLGSGSSAVYSGSYGNSYLLVAPYDYLTGGTPLYNDPVNGYQAISNGGQNVFGGGLRGNETAFDSLASGILSRMGGVAPSMVFGNGTVDAKISAMEQEGKADVLSSPKVTTQSGNEAVIRVVEIHRYPQDYDVETGQRTAPVVKPQDWEDFDLGVVLRVTPDVDAEKGTILLQLDPEIRKFKGFEDYAVAVNAYVLDDGYAGSTTYGDGSQLFARMPYFETRSVSTRVTVADGHTVMMGGLIDERTETFRDQVPILGDIPYIGRLFRSEGSRSEKKNLVIYVTATQVDEHGMTRAGRELARNAVSQ